MAAYKCFKRWQFPNCISIAGLGVAFHAKPIFKEKAQQSIFSVGLDGLLYLMGISEREIGQG